jgi:hypothetical protein
MKKMFFRLFDCFAEAISCLFPELNKLELARFKRLEKEACSTLNYRNFVALYREIGIEFEHAEDKRIQDNIAGIMERVNMHGQYLLRNLCGDTVDRMRESVCAPGESAVTRKNLALFDLHTDLIDDIMKNVEIGSVSVDVGIETVSSIYRFYG